MAVVAAPLALWLCLCPPPLAATETAGPLEAAQALASVLPRLPGPDDPAALAVKPILDALDAPTLTQLRRWDSLTPSERAQAAQPVAAAAAAAAPRAVAAVQTQAAAALSAVNDGRSAPSSLNPSISALGLAAALYGAPAAARQGALLRSRMGELAAKRALSRGAAWAAALSAPASRDELKSFLDARHAELIATRPDLFELKLKKARQSDFAMFRGFPELLYLKLKDAANANALAGTPRLRLDGDFHPENVELDPADAKLPAPQANDFDDSALGPAGLDLARLLAGVALVDTTQPADALAAEARQAYLAALSQSFPAWQASLAAENAVSDSVAADQRWDRHAGVKVQDAALAARLRALAGLSEDWEVYDRRGAGLSSIGVRRYMFVSAQHGHVFELKELRGPAVAFFTGAPAESDGQRIARAYAGLRQVPADVRVLSYDGSDWLLRRREARERPLALSHARSTARVMGGLLAQLHRGQASESALRAAAAVVSDSQAVELVAYFKQLRRWLEELVQGGAWRTA